MKRIWIVFLLFTYGLHAQSSWHGTVTDESGEPLAFVNILINADPHRGTSSDIDGKFELAADVDIRFLLFSYVSYESHRLDLRGLSPTKMLRIQMRPIALELETAVVIAGENPAHRIISEAIENRHKNDPEKLNSFSCKSYNKFIYDFLPQAEAFQKKLDKNPPKNKLAETRSGNIQKMMATADTFHLLVWETVTEKKYHRPGHYNEEVLYNRVSGLERPNFVALAQDLQPFSFYGDHLDILDRSYVNPISPGSTEKYFFELQDTLIQGQDSVFIIAFQPRKGKNFEALRGVLYIHTHQFAIQSVIARPANKNMMDMSFEQRYQLVDRQYWFPEQLNFEIGIPKYPSKFLGMRITGKSYITAPMINPDLEKKSFNNLAYSLGDDVYNKSDSVWQAHRVEYLKPKELRTYQKMDSLGQAIKLDKKIDLLSALAIGKYPIGKIDLRLQHVARFNNFEGARWGLGLETNDRVSKIFRIGAYAGYGTQDQNWKYGADLRFQLRDIPEMKLHFSYVKDIKSPDENSFSELSRGFIRNSFYSLQMDEMRVMSVSLNAEIFKYGSFSFKLQNQDIRPLYDYTFLGGTEPKTQFDITELGLHFRYSFAEQYIPAFGTKISQGPKHPIYQLSYIRGQKGLFNGNYSYHKLLFGLEHSFRLRGLGRTSFRLESGWVNGDIPYPKLFVGSGVGGGFQIFEIDYSFQTMELQEFVSNVFFQLFLSHKFGGFLYQHKYSKPEISLIQALGFGSLNQPELHQGLSFKTMEKGFLESGLVLDNIIRIPYINLAYIGLGAGVYYRYGAYAFPSLNDNLAYRLTLDFNF